MATSDKTITVQMRVDVRPMIVQLEQLRAVLDETIDNLKALEPDVTAELDKPLATEPDWPWQSTHKGAPYTRHRVSGEPVDDEPVSDEPGKVWKLAGHGSLSDPHRYPVGESACSICGQIVDRSAEAADERLHESVTESLRKLASIRQPGDFA